MWSVDLDAIEPMLAAKTFRKQVKSLQFTFLENGTIASHAIAKKAMFPRGEKHLYRIELPGKREQNNR